jgi:hypothetical protein
MTNEDEIRETSKIPSKETYPWSFESNEYGSLILSRVNKSWERSAIYVLYLTQGVGYWWRRFGRIDSR